MTLSVSTFIALRYMQSSRENRFFSWISLLSIAGIAIGVAAMIVVLSVINGFESELRKRFLSANAHIMAYRFPAGLLEPDRWASVVKRDFPDDVVGISSFVHYETMARHEGTMQQALVKGFSPRERESVQSLRSIVRPKDSLDIIQAEIDAARKGEPAPEIASALVGTGLLSILGGKVGDTIELISPDQDKVGDLKRFKVIGVYDSGLKHYDNRIVVLSLTSAQRFFKMEDRVTGIEIGIKDPYKSPALAKEMEEKYNISIREWQSFNRPLFEAMQMERAVIALIVALVAFVASFNILTTLFVSVSQKQRDISVLKSLGARRTQIMLLFLKQGALIGLVGSVVGGVLALAISAVLERYQFIDLPDLYLLARLPLSYDWRVYLTVCGSGILICLVAGLYPAWAATRVMPAEGLRGLEKA